MVRKNYVGLDIELVMFEKVDVVTGSIDYEEDQTPVLPGNLYE